MYFYTYLKNEDDPTVVASFPSHTHTHKAFPQVTVAYLFPMETTVSVKNMLDIK